MEEANRSLWLETGPPERFPRLRRDIEVDVAVVGGGLTGITTALHLARAGKRVAVLEALRVGEGVTGHTTAHLTEALDARYHKLIGRFGERAARLAARSQRDAIDRIESLVRDLGIDCGFRRVPGFLFTEREDDGPMLANEAEAAARIGVVASLVREVPLPWKTAAALRFERQATFHPMRYVMALALLLKGLGSYVFEESRVEAIEEGEPCIVRTNDCVVRARDVVVATHAPVGSGVTIHMKEAQYRSYVIAARLQAPLADALFWNTGSPYHYLRIHHHPSGDLAIIGGEDHKVGTEPLTEGRYERLAEYARARLGPLEAQGRWSGQVVETIDGLPYIGRARGMKHVLFATGFAGNGMTFGTVAGMLLADLLLGASNPYAELFDPTRVKPIASIGRFVRENVSFPAHFVGDRLRGAETSDPASIERGEGKILLVDGEKVACSRDAKGDLHAVSPICPHMGCYVAWNQAERSWDCPCHGSRFQPTGEVIDGPSMSPLAPKAAPAVKLARPSVDRHPHPRRELERER